MQRKMNKNFDLGSGTSTIGECGDKWKIVATATSSKQAADFTPTRAFTYLLVRPIGDWDTGLYVA
jgi:hypothetical protein